ncbi:MAG: 2Fe-2S iron-sulfur cluster binding domain-containing protein [Planctomycetes bacterium]|nr:2Fe-2S iron-sulfur cluster binding domain-containing protein [Planctomycetota bacterium]
MGGALHFVLNGEPVEVAGVDPRTTLLHWLRARGLTGAKEACGEGECGACAVVSVVPGRDGGSRYVAQNACLLLLPEADGAEIWTVEGFGRAGALHPVQQAIVAAHGSQCGYCTPGFVAALFAHHYAAHRPAPEQALAGNLCRCTGYRALREVAAGLPAPAAGDPFAARLRAPAPAARALHYEAAGARFDRPGSLAGALELRARHPEAVLLAGGTDLVAELNQRGSAPRHLISLGAVAELRACAGRGGTVTIGAGATWREIEERFAGRVPLFAQLLPRFASPLVRERATLGGNLMTASPVGDGAVALLALDAEAELASPHGSRRVPLHEFFAGYRRTVVGPGEILAAVHVPAAPPSLARFHKVTKRELDDIACVSAAIALWLDGGTVTRARLAFGGVAPTPARALAAEQALVGRRLDAASLAACQAAVAAAFRPISDVRASAAYRSALLGSLLARTWAEASP